MDLDHTKEMLKERGMLNHRMTDGGNIGTEEECEAYQISFVQVIILEFLVLLMKEGINSLDGECIHIHVGEL